MVLVPAILPESSLQGRHEGGRVALLIDGVNIPEVEMTAETAQQIITLLAAQGINGDRASLRASELPRHGRNTLRQVALMAVVTNPTNKFVSMTAAGPPGAHKVLIDLPGVGGIRARADSGVLRAKVSKLPFLGAGYAKFALVRSAMCVSEPHTAERVKLFTNSVLNVKVNEILTEMATDEQAYIDALTATSSDSSASSDKRELAFKKLRPSRDYLHAVEEVRSNPTIFFEVFVESPNAFDVLDVLDQTINFMERNDADASVRQIRSNVGRAFAMEAGLMYLGRLQTGVTGCMARALTTVTTKLLTMTDWGEPLKLFNPRFVASSPRVVAVNDAHVKFATSELVKTKLHLIACQQPESGTEDPDNHMWGYDHLACQNLSVESNTAFVIMHDLHPQESQRWASTLVEMATQRGQMIGIDVEYDRMYVEEYDVIGGAAAGVTMWRLDDAIMDTNVHTGLNVAPTFEVQEVTHCMKDPTPVWLQRVIGDKGLKPMIQQWSRRVGQDLPWANDLDAVDDANPEPEAAGRINARFAELEAQIAQQNTVVDTRLNAMQTDIAAGMNAMGQQMMQGLAALNSTLQLQTAQQTSILQAMASNGMTVLPATAATIVQGGGAAAAPATVVTPVIQPAAGVPTQAPNPLATIGGIWAAGSEEGSAAIPPQSPPPTGGGPTAPEFCDGLVDFDDYYDTEGPSYSTVGPDVQNSKSPYEWGSTGTNVGSPARILSLRQVIIGKVSTKKSSDCVSSALPPGTGAPMTPEECNGLTTDEPVTLVTTASTSGTSAATSASTLRRSSRLSLQSPSAGDETDEAKATVTEPAPKPSSVLMQLGSPAFERHLSGVTPRPQRF